jgi:type II secretory ATPase GspE/PulE/Tfp pilus assembly ATPase PilB-like protein
MQREQDGARRKATKYDGLIADGVLTQEELQRAVLKAREDGKTVEQVLTEDFSIKPAALGGSLAKFFGAPYEGFNGSRIRVDALQGVLKPEFVMEQGWIPLEESPEGLVIMCLDPEAVRGSRIVPQIYPRNAKVAWRVTTQSDFNQTLNQLWGASADSGGSVEDMLADLGGPLDDDGSEDNSLESAAADNELVKFVNKVIVDAYNQRASDIHIEPLPGKGKTGVRFRKDGSLGPYIEVPASYRSPLVTRLKIMCDLDISEKRKPQDGKIKFKKYGPLDIELRVATIPTAGGVEDVVMRILAAGEPIPLDKLGVLPANLERLKACVSKPYGLFFVCGPTGSGKTTTLHSVLGFLNTPDTKIWTAEDPVEITQKGLRQCQVNPKAGFTFATAMKSFLRADPDIIMVGEMRDKDTTSIGIEASLTGHLVFATLHTNSAPESIIRLLDMGMDPFNFADALLGILAQRLAKRLCKCKEAYKPTQEEIKHFLTEYCEELKNTEDFKKDVNAGYKKVFDRFQADYGFGKADYVLYKPKGCDACNGSGYKGRVGLHELMVGSDAVKKLIQEHARVAQLFTQALADGMLTLKMDGMEKVLQGVTDMFQVRAVCIK